MSQGLPITLGDWFSRGWYAFRTNPKPIIGGAVILSAFYWILRLVGLVPGGFIVTLLGHVIVGPVLGVGWCFLCLGLVRGDNAKSSDIFGAFSRFGAAWVTCFLLFLIVFGGIILLIVPGIIWSLKYGLSLFVVMDKNLKATDCIRLSGIITKGHKGKLFIYSIVGLLFGLLAWPFHSGLQHLGTGTGTLLLVIGIVLYLLQILVTTPWLGATYAAAYDSLISLQQVTQTEEAPQTI